MIPHLSRKSILVIAVLLLVPSGIAFAANINGTEFNDIILGTNKKDNISAHAGSDVVMGLGNPARESMSGNEGADELVGDQDILGLCAAEKKCKIGNPGKDTLAGNAGSDFLVGDGLNDGVFGNDAPDVLFGGPGDDRLTGGDDDDELFGGFGNDELNGGAGNDHLYGGPDNDRLRGGPGQDFLDGGEDVDGFDQDICFVVPAEDTWVNCETVIDVTGQTPPQTELFEIANLFVLVNSADSLKQSDQNTLLSVLNDLQDKADAADINGACNEVTNFLKQVNRLLDRNKIDPLEGDPMIVDANTVNNISCL